MRCSPDGRQVHPQRRVPKLVLNQAHEPWPSRRTGRRTRPLASTAARRDERDGKDDNCQEAAATHTG